MKTPRLKPRSWSSLSCHISPVFHHFKLYLATLDRKFRYAVGQTYTYSFVAKTKTWMMGTSDDQALLEIKGQALVIFRAPCDAVLQLRQITVSGNLDEKVGYLMIFSADN